jgi:hypothetical protein
MVGKPSTKVIAKGRRQKVAMLETAGKKTNIPVIHTLNMS